MRRPPCHTGNQVQRCHVLKHLWEQPATGTGPSSSCSPPPPPRSWRAFWGRTWRSTPTTTWRCDQGLGHRQGQACSCEGCDVMARDVYVAKGPVAGSCFFFPRKRWVLPIWNCILHARHLRVVNVSQEFRQRAKWLLPRGPCLAAVW